MVNCSVQQREPVKYSGFITIKNEKDKGLSFYGKNNTKLPAHIKEAAIEYISLRGLQYSMKKGRRKYNLVIPMFQINRIFAERFNN